MKTRTSAGQFVLENRQGQVVRTFNWEHTQLSLVYNQDTRRIESHSSLQQLEDEGIPFKLIAQVTPAEVQKRPVAIDGGGQLKWLQETPRFSPNFEMSEEKENLPGFLRWAAIVQISLLFLVLALNHFISPVVAPSEEHTVTVIPQMEITKEQLKEQLKEQAKEQSHKAPVTPKHGHTAAISTTKERITKAVPKGVKVAAHAHAGKKLAHVSGHRIKGGGNAFGTANGHGKTHDIGFAGPDSNMDGMGALGVLSQSNSKSSRGGGGLNLKAVKNERGTGLGGGPGTGNGNGGGNPHALLGHGLLAGAPGIGNGSGHGIGTPGKVGSGYGTHGKGNGGAGYGTYRLGGTAKGSSEYAGNGVGNGKYNPFANSVYGDEDEMTVAGGLTDGQISDVINRHTGEVTFCYEQGLQIKPSLAGRVAIHFVIGGAGSVNTAKITHTSVHSSSVESCIVGRLKAWHFPHPVGGVNVNVTYPFVLKRVSQG